MKAAVSSTESLLPWVHDTLSLLWKWFTCKHTELPSPRAEFFPSASLSKCSNNSISALKFLINISEKTKANDRALECLFNILNPYVIFRLYWPRYSFGYLSESRRTLYTMIVILKQVVRGISAIEGTTNNDCHQSVF